ncbi:MAG: recombination-associated protein RdgC [Pseudomonadota bacterium]|nr:recombination-associated protein RdgC [Pseudomonadota bacterium]
MSLKKGTLTFTRLRLVDPLPADFSAIFADRIGACAFRDFFPENEEKSVGWTALQDILDNDFKYANHTLGDYRVFSLRIDRKKVPGPLLRLRILEAERRLREARGGRKLSREEREGLHGAVHQELLARTLPLPSLFDCCWNLAAGTIWFSGHGEKALQEFQDFFRETFAMGLTLYTPWEDAAPTATSDDDPAALFLTQAPGREFLTWLWFKSEERNGRIDMGGDEEVVLLFVRRLVLESGKGDYTESVVCQGRHASLLEGKEALRQGKKIRAARLSLELDTAEWEFTFKADLFQYQAMKVPAPTEEFGDNEEMAAEGRLLERIFLVEKAVAVMDRLFAAFQALRLSGAWEAESARMEGWINRRD